MKKFNFWFWGQCILIFALLLVISGLLKEEKIGSNGSTEISQVIAREEEGQKMDRPVEQEEKQDRAAEQEKKQNVREESGKDMEAELTADIYHEEKEAAEILTTKEVVDREEKTQIVVFGDSIWNDARGVDGISEFIMQEKNVHIYNCSIGGTTAAVYKESTQWDSWTSNSFNGMMYLVNDIISEDQLIPNETANGIFKEIDFNQVDYIIVAYGLNDYFSDIPIYPQEYYDLTSYVGALRHGIHKIREKYPHIEFIIASPTYCEWFKGERQFELGAYAEAARGVAEEMGVHFVDMYHAFGAEPEDKTEYLEDGVHLTKEGRELYSRSIVDFLTTQGIK